MVRRITFSRRARRHLWSIPSVHRYALVYSINHVSVLLQNPHTDSLGKQVANMSWWPKASTWESGSLDNGYWTSFAEVWFQKRLDRIRSHEAKPKTASGWRDELKCAHNAKKLRKMTETALQQFFFRSGPQILTK